MSRRSVFSHLLSISRGGVVTLAFVTAGHAIAASRTDNPISVAVKHGDCKTAVRLLKEGIDVNDDEAYFLAGRMLDEGICVNQDSLTATRMYEIASIHGHRDSSLEYAAKIGLGEGEQQDFERAGEICRAAGLAAAGPMSSYSLGYACTLRGFAGRALRVSLPAGAFRPKSGDAIVEFNPASATMRVKATPVVRRVEAATGTSVGRNSIDAEEQFQSAWSKALARVPKPDPQKLDSSFVALPIDVEMAIEHGVEADPVGSDSFRLLDRRQMMTVPGAKAGG